MLPYEFLENQNQRFINKKNQTITQHWFPSPRSHKGKLGCPQGEDEGVVAC
jgi:hypothetical protein